MTQLNKSPTRSGRRSCMPRKKESLQYQMLQMTELSKNRNTLKSQKNTVKDFAEWCKSEGVRDVSEIEDRAGLLQRYADQLVADGRYTPSTIHTKLAGPCKALQVSMAKIDKPRRTQSTLVRGRSNAHRGAVEASQERYAKSVALAKALGLRRAELRRPRGTDLVTFAGYLCVRVENGKGGKDTYQRVLPGYEETVRQIFTEAGPNRVLRDRDLGHHIDYHSIRAQTAVDAYRYYESKAQTAEGRNSLYNELRDYYRALHRGGDAGRWLKQTLLAGHGVYHLRGQNRTRAQELGRPIEYNRLALLAVSVFHLSHWRLDVTVTNYMLH